MTLAETPPATAAGPPLAPRWVKVLDQTRCIGCHACTTACKSENQVPVGVTRTYVKSVEIGTFPQVRRAFQVTRCNQCTDAPCVAACPTGAMYKRPDGIVDFDKRVCIGCKACMAACPYDAIFINPDDHSAEKCNFCAHRLDLGLEPACVVVCPTEAILIGDLNDPSSKVSQLVNRDVVAVRRPEKGTRPKLFYKGAHQATLDPLAARRPAGGLFLWSQQRRGPHHQVGGHPQHPNSSAAALLAYDGPHSVPWDWRVSAYTWTKGLAAGVFLVAALLVLAGRLPVASVLWRIYVPLISGVFLALTGGLLVLDLEHPERFYLVLTRGRPQSWLVRGAYLISAYAALLALQFLLGLLGLGSALFAWFGLPLALSVAVYTAYLLAQARARDLWQSPLLPPHLAVQAGMVGSAALLPLLAAFYPALWGWVAAALAAATAAHLLFVAAELGSHATAHAELAAWEMTRGRWAGWFRAGLLLSAVGLLAPWWGGVAAAAVLVGLFLHEHAYLQAGQSVPLA